MKSNKLFLVLLLTVVLIGINADIVYSDADDISYYINSIYYNNKLEVIRTSYDRWNNIIDTHHPDKHPTDINHHFYATVYDFNYAYDTTGQKIYPQLIGFAFGWEFVGLYFIAHTSDIANHFRDEIDKSEGEYNAGTVGMNIDLKLITLQGDVTRDSEQTTFYSKAYIPLLETYCGARFSRYESEEVLGRNKIRRSENYTYDVVNAGSSLLRVFNLGFSYYPLIKAKYAPNISTSIHQFMGKDSWESVGYDLEIYFESKSEKLNSEYKLEDYEVRVVLYWLLGRSLVSSRSSTSDVGIAVRPAFFVGVSYKSFKDSFRSTVLDNNRIDTKEERDIWHDSKQDGVGVEAGIGLRIFGFRRFGFREDTYVKLAYFYNYSQYYERYPGIQHGVKFRVVY